MAAKKRSKGEGSFHRRKSDGRWVAEIQLGYDPETGKLIRRYAYAPADAKESVIVAKLHELRARLQREGAMRMPTSTVREFFDRWLEERKRIVRHRTHENEELVWRLYISPSIGGRQLTSLNVDELQRLFRRLEVDEVGARTRLLIHTTLSVALGDAVRWSLLVSNTMTLLNRPTYKAPEKKALSSTQARKLARVAADDRLGALVVLALFTGLRQSELFGLQWSDLDVAHSSLAVRRAVSEVSGKPTIGETKNASSRRAVFLAPIVLEALAAHRKRMDLEKHGSEYIFVTPTGQLLQKSNFIRRVFHPLRDAAGLPATITFHALRHTTATLLLEAGIHPKIVGDMLGFASTSILLDTYSHTVNPKLQQAAAAALSAALNVSGQAKRAGKKRA